MKKIIFIPFIFLLAFYINCFAQLDNPVVRLTTGNNDWNPTFSLSNSQYYICEGYNWAFMAFERVIGTSSQIMVTKIDLNGALDTGLYITNNIYINRNPAIAHNVPDYYSPNIRRAIIVWETNKNGNWDLYASIYYYLTGWSAPIRVDTSLTDESNVSVKYFDSTFTAIVYQSSNDIKFKNYNFITNTFSADSNLTSAELLNCGRPYVQDVSVYPQKKLLITYEKEISTTQKAVYYKLGDINNNIISWIRSDTISYTGLNQNGKFIIYISNSANCYYETKRSGKWNIYYTGLNFSTGALTNVPVITENYFDDNSYAGNNLPLGDNTTHTYYGYLRKSVNDIKAVIKGGYTDSITIPISNNTSYAAKLSKCSLPSGVGCIKCWMVFNKDSLNPQIPSRIYGTYAIGCAMNISENNLPVKFNLSQNYPNPFNPTTKIKFSIPPLEGGKGGMIVLKVYNILGKEIATLVNGKLHPGVYEVPFSIDKFTDYQLSSGVYYYKLEAGEFSDVKKMILLK